MNRKSFLMQLLEDQLQLLPLISRILRTLREILEDDSLLLDLDPPHCQQNIYHSKDHNQSNECFHTIAENDHRRILNFCYFRNFRGEHLVSENDREQLTAMKIELKSKHKCSEITLTKSAQQR